MVLGCDMVNGPCMYVTACFCVSRAIEDCQFGYRIFSMVGHKKAKFMAKNYSIVMDSNADLTVGNWKSK